MIALHSTARLILLATGLTAWTASGWANAEEVTAPGAKLEKVADGFVFTEGPAVDAQGDVYFTDQPNDTIHRWIAAENRVEKFLTPSGRSNGLFFAANGGLIACADEKNELWTIERDGSHRVLAGEFGGKLLNGPNDAWVMADGTIFFTDPYYKRPWWKHEAEPQEKRCVYRYEPDTGDVERVAEDFRQPNGIVGDEQRGLLFVADIEGNQTFVFRITPERTLVERRVFCAQGSDGMTLDREGHLYLTGKDGVYVYSSTGELVQTIKVPESWTANVCFGGAERDRLFITASDSLYSIPMRTRGL
jgi:gluconolactonase